MKKTKHEVRIVKSARQIIPLSQKNMKGGNYGIHMGRNV